jgi:hypothetical protein
VYLHLYADGRNPPRHFPPAFSASAASFSHWRRGGKSELLAAAALITRGKRRSESEREREGGKESLSQTTVAAARVPATAVWAAHSWDGHNSNIA